ncbi:MAG: response regulator [Armatimonadetes bacterium]|nr:response regulator [Armatimonadota bacterium]
MKKISLRHKFTAYFSFFVIAISLIFGIYFYYRSREILEAQLVSKGIYIARNLAYNAGYGVAFENKEDLSHLVQGAFDEENVAYVFIANCDGKTLAEKYREDATRSAVSGPTEGCPVLDPRISPDVVVDKSQFYNFVAPVKRRQSANIFQIEETQVQKKTIQVGSVKVGLSQKKLNQDLASVFLSSASLALLLIGLGFLGSYSFLKVILEPLEKMTRTAQSIADGDLSQRVSVKSNDETGELAASFNEMARALENRERELTQNYQELEKWNTELEKRVEARTYELIAANRALETANRELEEASRVKSEFLANTSHELRTPLNAILGFLSLIIDGDCASREEEIELLTDARKSGKHLLSLINDILDIAKIEAGKLELRVEEIPVTELFQALQTMCHVQAEQKGLKLSFEGPAPLPSVSADRGRLVQVLVNLIGNALKFTQKGGITVQAIPFAEKGYMQFAVRDTGIGIKLPKENQHSLFESFKQLDGSHTRRYGGTGLGLAISKNLVEMMGGVIHISSDGENCGTTVIFTIPLCARIEESEEMEKIKNGNAVLVVEDDRSLRKYLKELLTKRGFAVISAGTADEAVNKAIEYRPKVVILDYALPWEREAIFKNGGDVLRFLMDAPETKDSEVILITGHDPQILKQRLSFDFLYKTPEILQKPIEPDVLLSKLERIQKDINKVPATVLLTDDDPNVAKFIKMVLPKEKFNLLTAGNGNEALDLISSRGKEIDILLLDLLMPEKGGYEVIRELKLDGKAPDLPIIVITNYPEAQTEEEKRLLSRETILEVVSKYTVFEDPDCIVDKLTKYLLKAVREA